MGVLETILGDLGLLGSAGGSAGPVPGVDNLSPPLWTVLPFTTEKHGAGPPYTWAVAAPTQDTSALTAITAPYAKKAGIADMVTPLKTAGLIRDDPGDNTKFQVNLKVQVKYPAMQGKPNEIAGTDKLPLVVLNHGMHKSWVATSAGAITVTDSYLGYGYLQDALAQNGIISMSVDHNLAGVTGSYIETRADTLIAALNALYSAAGSTSSRYSGRIDFSSIGIMGHSRGGDAVVRAAKKIRADATLSSQFTIKAICSLAPTDFTGATAPGSRTSLATGDAAFYLVVYGALDQDVYGDGADALTATGFRHYDRAAIPKAMVFLDNCCHNAFNTVWWADIHDSTDSRLASDTDHQTIAVDYIGDLFRWQLKGEALAQRLDGRKPNRAGQHASQQWVFGQAVQQVDDFETSPNNLEGGTRAVTTPAGTTVEVKDFGSVAISGKSLNPHTPHETQVLHADLTALTSNPSSNRVLSTDIVAADQDWSGYDTLIFNLSGWFDPTSPASVAAAPLPQVTVTLIDAAAATKSVDNTVYGATLPSRPMFKMSDMDGSNVTLMRLETIPVTLSAFTGVDLTKVAHVAVDIVPSDKTHIFVDNISVLKRQ